MKRFLITIIWCGAAAALHAATGTSVSWSIGKASSTVDGIAGSGPVTFTWTFDRPVTYGSYVDGTPWVLWEDGLQLVGVTPAETTFDAPDYGSDTVRNCRVDLTCINLKEDRLPLDQRMNGKFDPDDVWDGSPAQLSPGDCIATGRGRRSNGTNSKTMIFSALGVCTIVAADMSGRFRPPVRMPAHLRAGLVTPRTVGTAGLPAFNVPSPRLWDGTPAVLDYNKVINTFQTFDADDLLNGPDPVCGIYQSLPHCYEAGRADLNQDLNGGDRSGYQRDCGQRYAVLLYTAFNPAEDSAKRQRSLNKFLQGGLDYFYQYCLGYPVWDGGGGHSGSLEGIITLTGAILGDSTITNTMRYQRFPGHAVGRGDTVVDMLATKRSLSDFSRTEALYMVAPAPWQSGTYACRSIGNGAASADAGVIRLDMAHAEHVLNNARVPFTSVTRADDQVVLTGAGTAKLPVTVDSCSIIAVDPSFTWPMWERNDGTEAQRSYNRIINAVVRINGDTRIRKIIGFQQTADLNWTETSWNTGAQGTGGILFVYPPLSPDETAGIPVPGSLATGICSYADLSDGNGPVLWNSWGVDGEARVLNTYCASPAHRYLGNKLGANLYWYPFYTLLDDPAVPGTKLAALSDGFRLTADYLAMLRRSGQFFWDILKRDYNMPETPTMQALSMHCLLEYEPVTRFCKTYETDDTMWNEAPAGITAPDNAYRAAGPARPGLMTRAMFLNSYPGAVLYTLDGTPVNPAIPATGIYLVKFTGQEPAQTVILCN